MNINADMSESDLEGEDYDTSNVYVYTLSAVVVIGLPLMVIALYKIYIEHQHYQEMVQAQKEKMEEYRAAKSGLASNLQREVNATRVDGEIQRMKLEENERTLRQQHKKEMRQQEARFRERERELEANIREINRLKEEDVERERKNSRQYQRRVQETEQTVAFLKETCNDLEKRADEQTRTILNEGKNYQRLNDQYISGKRRWEREEAALIDEKQRLQNKLAVSNSDKEKLRVSLKMKEEELSRERERTKKDKKRSWNLFSTSDSFQIQQTSAESSVYNEAVSAGGSSVHDAEETASYQSIPSRQRSNYTSKQSSTPSVRGTPNHSPY